MYRNTTDFFSFREGVGVGQRERERKNLSRFHAQRRAQHGAQSDNPEIMT